MGFLQKTEEVTRSHRGQVSGSARKDTKRLARYTADLAEVARQQRQINAIIASLAAFQRQGSYAPRPVEVIVDDWPTSRRRVGW